MIICNMMIEFVVPIPTQLDNCLFHSWTVVALDIQPFSNRDVSLCYFWKVICACMKNYMCHNNSRYHAVI